MLAVESATLPATTSLRMTRVYEQLHDSSAWNTEFDSTLFVTERDAVAISLIYRYKPSSSRLVSRDYEPRLSRQWMRQMILVSRRHYKKSSSLILPKRVKVINRRQRPVATLRAGEA